MDPMPICNHTFLCPKTLLQLLKLLWPPVLPGFSFRMSVCAGTHVPPNVPLGQVWFQSAEAEARGCFLEFADPFTQKVHAVACVMYA